MPEASAKKTTTKPAAKAAAKPAAAKPAVAAGAAPAKAEKKVALLQGIVESDKTTKTRTVVVQRSSMHSKYGKIVRRRKSLYVHDEGNLSRLGDLVEVEPCRPMSKTKRFRLVRVVQQGVGLRAEAVAAPET
jgi:small subunit ribosomal protein S17